MLTIVHKANILRKAGLQVPPEAETAASHWAHAVETLYVAYAAARAAKSLRDSEEARQMDMLRRLSSSGAMA